MITISSIKRLVILPIIISSLLLSSCVSGYILDRKERGYYEIFYNYYTGNHNNDLVFVGKKYHYVFKDRFGYISELTKNKWKSKLTISTIDLSVNKDNKVTGSIYIKTSESLDSFTKQDVALLEKYGFKKFKNEFLAKTLNLNGIRYRPRKNSKKDKQNHLSKYYKVKIKYILSKGEKIKKAAITPIAYTAEGAFIVVGGVWAPLVILAFTKEYLKSKDR